MSTLLKNRQVVEDTWRLIGLSPEAQTALPPDGVDAIVPLPLWREQRAPLLRRAGRTGVWLEPSDEPGELFANAPLPELIAVRFPVFTDGRGYSIARLLRERHGYRGEVRAIGDVLQDTLFELARCGFDAFALRADQDPAAALAAFGEFSEVYQAAADRGPLFARRFPEVLEQRCDLPV
jgi:uncharacterized protein (DUF934 family)